MNIPLKLKTIYFHFKNKPKRHNFNTAVLAYDVWQWLLLKNLILKEFLGKGKPVIETTKFVVTD